MAGATEDARKQLTETIDLLKRYFLQETLGPLKNLGRSLAYGLLGGIALGIGLVLLIMAGLRALQEETGTFHGNWSWVPYLLAVVAALAAIGLLGLYAVKRPIGRDRGAQGA
jgi:hypothetical protein